MSGDEYKATGRQLEIDPWARGISFPEWRATRPLTSQGAVEVWIRQREKAKAERNRKSPKRLAQGELE